MQVEASGKKFLLAEEKVRVKVRSLLKPDCGLHLALSMQPPCAMKNIRGRNASCSIVC